MNYAEYLEKEQTTAYKIFYNAFKNNQVFHAYLLSGQAGTPLLEISKFLAKSLICKNKNPFACNSCSDCLRIDNEIYGDLIIIDGKKEPIKKESIHRIEEEFSKTSLEKSGIKIYIINLIENMTSDSVSVLLKFLEEPTENTYAFLTTENEFRVLPTILSRTQIVHFNSIDKKTLIEESLKNGVSNIDAELLSNFYNDFSSIKNESENEDYKEIKKLTLDIFSYIKNKEELRFYFENNIVKNKIIKLNIRFFFDILIFIFKESYVYYFERQTIFKSFESIFVDLNNYYSNIDIKIIDLMDRRNELNYNINIDLLLINVLDTIF